MTRTPEAESLAERCRLLVRTYGDGALLMTTCATLRGAGLKITFGPQENFEIGSCRLSLHQISAKDVLSHLAS